VLSGFPRRPVCGEAGHLEKHRYAPHVSSNAGRHVAGGLERMVMEDMDSGRQLQILVPDKNGHQCMTTARPPCLVCAVLLIGHAAEWL